MGRPKGSKNRVKEEMAAPEPIQEPTPEPEVNLTEGSPQFSGDMMTEEEREAIYDNLSDQLYPEEPSPEDVKPEPEPEPEVQPEPEPEVQPEPEPVVQEPEPYQPSTPDVKEDRTVPYQALAEERNKRKQMREEIDSLKAEMQQLMRQNLDMKRRVDTSQDYGYEQPENNQELEMLKQELSELKNRLSYTESTAQQRELQRAKETVNAQLESEGYEGFMFFEPMVAAEVNRRINENPDDTFWDTPSGWMQVFKETYPSIKGRFARNDKEAIFSQKRELKEKAAKIGHPGRREEPTATSSKEESFEEERERYRREFMEDTNKWTVGR